MASRRRIVRSSTSLLYCSRPSYPYIASTFYSSKATTTERKTPQEPSTSFQASKQHVGAEAEDTQGYSQIINIIKPKSKTQNLLNPANFGNLKRSADSDQIVSLAKQKTSAFIPSDKAQRFALHLFLTSLPYPDQLPKILSDLSQFASLVQNNPYYTEMFKSSLTPPGVRRQALQSYLSTASLSSPLSHEVFRVLADIKALPLISSVVSSLTSLSDLYNKKIDINVTLAQDSKEERSRVEDQLKKMIGDQAQVNFIFKVDPDLISGLKAEAKGQLLIDTSGRKGLEDEVAKEMSRLDQEISLRKKMRKSVETGEMGGEAEGKRRWEELRSEVQRMSEVKKEVQGGKGETQSAEGEVEDNERVRALTDIYKFKRSK